MGSANENIVGLGSLVGCRVTFFRNLWRAIFFKKMKYTYTRCNLSLITYLYNLCKLAQPYVRAGRSSQIDRTLEFFLNEFYRIYRICRIWNIFFVKRCIRTCYLLCNKPGCYHSARETQETERICKVNLIYASVIFQIFWIHWIQWKFASFRKNFIVEI